MGYLNDNVRRVWASVAAGTTDAEIFPAQSGYRLRVLAAFASATAATALTFNTKPSGSGVAITPAFTSAAGVPTVDLSYNDCGWFESLPGEGLTVTTGAGQTTQIVVTLALQPASDAIYDETMIDLLGEDSVPLLAESA